MSTRSRFPNVLIALALVLSVVSLATPTATALPAEAGDGGTGSQTTAAAPWAESLHQAWDWVLSSLGLSSTGTESNSTTGSQPTGPQGEEGSGLGAGMDPLG